MLNIACCFPDSRFHYRTFQRSCNNRQYKESTAAYTERTAHFLGHSLMPGSGQRLHVLLIREHIVLTAEERSPGARLVHNTAFRLC